MEPPNEAFGMKWMEGIHFHLIWSCDLFGSEWVGEISIVCVVLLIITLMDDENGLTVVERIKRLKLNFLCVL